MAGRASPVRWSKPGAGELARDARLRPEGLALAAGAAGPDALLERLLAHDRPYDAVRLLAAGLPARHAVWWGCLCVRRSAATLPAPQEAALRAAAAWVADPT